MATESLKEKIARARAEKAALDSLMDAKDKEVTANAEAVKVEAAKVEEKPVVQTQVPVVETSAPTEPAKPLTFAEKMAAKRATEAASKPVPVADTPTSAPIVVKTHVVEPTVQKAAEATVDEQKYADIASRIHDLADLSEDDLAPAMSKLKASLMANPAACMLMLDEDLGLMVTALRRITHVTIVDAKDAKKEKKPKASKVVLSADQLEAAFDEL